MKRVAQLLLIFSLLLGVSVVTGSQVGGSVQTAESVSTDYPTDINDPILEAERDAAALQACRDAKAAMDGTKEEEEAACQEAAKAAWKAKKIEQQAIIDAGGETSTTTTTAPNSTTTNSTTSTTSVPTDYPTDINDPILEAERDAAALQACRDAKAAMNAPKDEEEAACQEAAKAAWKAKKIEQQAIIDAGGETSTTTTTAPNSTTTSTSTTTPTTATSTTTTSPTTTTSVSSDYPTDINDPILEAERDAAALQACRDAKAAIDGTKEEEEAACQEAAKAAWKAKKIEQQAIIDAGGETSTTTTTAGNSTTTTTSASTTTTVPTDGPSGSQFMFFAQNLQQTATSYAEPSTSGPSNWKSPINYANGRVYMKYVVKSKPSSDPLKVQVCLWRHSKDGVRDFKYETCSASKLLTVRDEGTYYVDLGTPSSWWALNNNWDWSKGYDIVRIMHKYTKNGVDYLPMTKSCGSFCLGDAALRMVPIDLRVEVVVVASNNRLTRPSGWTCLSSWNCA